MPCYFPMRAWRGKGLTENGKKPIVFDRRARDLDCAAIELPCGRCIGCRLERSRQWAMRCVHESALHVFNCFVTLTYRDECLPSDGSLSVRPVQLFMKRLRKRFDEIQIRFFCCGEYGEKYGRPHYHACLFGFDFLDKVFHSEKNGNKLYTSKVLDDVWGLAAPGMCKVGAVSFESAAYVARYITKKIKGDAAEAHYGRMRFELASAIWPRKAEFVVMSRGGRGGLGGIGKAWYEKYKADCYPSDSVVMRGIEMRPPRFYDGLYEAESPVEFEDVKFEREKLARSMQKGERTSERRAVKEIVKRANIRSLSRTLDGEL